jgi:hypothetical protein
MVRRTIPPWRAARVVCGLAAAALAGAVNGPAHAQATSAVRVRVDNDGFAFWKRPALRTDGEYTNGVHMTIESGRAPLWGRLARRTPPCAGKGERAPRCSSTLFVIGQDMYTPAEDSQPGTYPGWRSQRPYAGWLFASATAQIVRGSTIRAIGLTLGVTGPPSLADQTQRAAHRRMLRHTTVPVGWETQVRFEPGVILSAHQRWLLVSARANGIRLLDASVGAGASVGNILTNAEARGDLRAGINLSHPWRRARRRGPVELLASIGVRGQAVARNIFLDGNTINPDRRVERVPFVGDVRGSAGIRLGPLVLAYAVTQRGREYRTGPRRHTFASLVAGIGGMPDASP